MDWNCVGHRVALGYTPVLHRVLCKVHIACFQGRVVRNVTTTVQGPTEENEASPHIGRAAAGYGMEKPLSVP